MHEIKIKGSMEEIKEVVFDFSVNCSVYKLFYILSYTANESMSCYYLIVIQMK